MSISNRNKGNKQNNIRCWRGDLFYADMGIVEGSEQGGVRPVVIIQNNTGNRFSTTVVVASITSKINKANLPTHVKLDKQECNNLDTYSMVMLEQIRTLSKTRLKEKIGRLSKEEMDRVDEAIKVSLALK